MPTISVIVPVYKVEQYLPACVDSILAQSFTDFELILVDDGSPDSCGAMCDAYAAQDSRVKVIHRENGGLSAARNSGIGAAQGLYTTFIDSDDLVAANFLEALYDAATQTGAEIAISFPKPFPDGQAPNTAFRKPGRQKSFTGAEAVAKLYQGSHMVPVNACAKLFQTALITDMRFPEGRLHEDQAYVPIACYRASRITYVDSTLYFYRDRPESITRTKFSLKRYDDIWAIDQCIAFFEQQQEPEIIRAALEKRRRLLCIYAIYAKRDHIALPLEYQVPSGKALRYLRKHVSDEKYAYYLAQLHPRLVRPHAYWVKLRKLGKRPR